jgi:hypothetical protein
VVNGLCARLRYGSPFGTCFRQRRHRLPDPPDTAVSAGLPKASGPPLRKAVDCCSVRPENFMGLPFGWTLIQSDRIPARRPETCASLWPREPVRAGHHYRATQKKHRCQSCNPKGDTPCPNIPHIEEKVRIHAIKRATHDSVDGINDGIRAPDQQVALCEATLWQGKHPKQNKAGWNDRVQHRIHDQIKARQVALFGQQRVTDPRHEGNRQRWTRRQPVWRHTTQRNRCAHQTHQRVRPNCKEAVINPQRTHHRRAVFAASSCLCAHKASQQPQGQSPRPLPA